MNLLSYPYLKKFLWLAPMVLILLSACTTITSYDQYAYAAAVGLKVDTLDLAGMATESYASHAQDIVDLTVRLNKAYEYDRGRPLNQKSVQLWEYLLITKPDDPDSGVYQHFVQLWKTQGRLSAVAVDLKKKTLSRDFDRIIGLESGKIKPGELN
jgi:hypothetical protein